jgi:hypothetical protein
MNSIETYFVSVVETGFRNSPFLEIFDKIKEFSYVMTIETCSSAEGCSLLLSDAQLRILF